MTTAKSFPIGSAEGLAKAQLRIAEAKRCGAAELDLSGLGLAAVPEELTDLVNLTRLYLGGNGIGTDGARRSAPSSTSPALISAIQA